MKIFIAGTTGQLGYAITEKLARAGHEVIALHRSSSDTSALRQLPGVSLAEGDLLDPASLKPALQGVEVVLSTANSAVPTRKEDHFKNDVRGHSNLIRAAKEANVRQFIFTSAIPFGPYDGSVPISRSKRHTEAELKASGIPFTIFQPAAFMDIYFAFFGTELTMQGAAVTSLKRPFKFMNNFFDGVRRDIADKGTFNILGKGELPASYICIDNVADFHVRAIDAPKATNRIIEIGGPEALRPIDIKPVFEEIHGKNLKIKSTPVPVIGILSKIMGLFNANAGNILAMQYAGAKVPGVVLNARETAEEFGVRLKSAREFLMEKKALAQS
jgi:uncharacterized protein YbjT (DUF2867 family)